MAEQEAMTPMVAVRLLVLRMPSEGLLASAKGGKTVLARGAPPHQAATEWDDTSAAGARVASFPP